MSAAPPEGSPAAAPADTGRYWPRRFTLVGLCFLGTFVCYIDRVNISVASIAMAADLGWSETLKGFVLSSFFIGYLITQVPGGWLANRYGGRLVLGLAVLWWSIFTIITPPAAFVSVTVLVVIRIAMGLGEGMAFPSMYNLYGRWVPAQEKSRTVALTFSGISLGTLFALSGTGWVVGAFGWPTVFYAFGAVGFFWVAAWFWRVTNTPSEHPTISAAELEHIQRTAAPPQPPTSVPWREIFSKPSVWALIVNHFCTNWGFYVLLAWLPSYFKNALGVSLQAAGLLSAAPWLTMFAMTNVAAWIADGLLKRGVRVIVVRKAMQHIGLLGAALFLFLLRDVSSVGQATLFLCCALGLLSFCLSGFATNHLDIAPRYADVLLGITNTAGTIPGIVGVYITGWLVDQTGGYGAAFVLAAGIFVFGSVVWQFFATGEKIVE